MMFERVDWTLKKESNNKLDLSNNVCFDSILQNQIAGLFRNKGPVCNQYADEGVVYDILSEYYGISSRQIAIGLGLGELIPRIFQLYKDRKFSIATPTWMMATGFCEVYNINYVEGIDTSADVLYIANPNGMTGEYTHPDKIRELFSQFELVIIDEAYAEFCVEIDCSLISSAITLDNVIVCKTLSKSLALPGLRFGYCFSNEKTIYEIQKVRPSGVCNTIIPSIGIELFELIPQHVKRMLDCRTYIQRKYDCVPSHSNFVLLKNKEKFLDFVKYKTINGLHRMSLLDYSSFRYYEEISNL